MKQRMLGLMMAFVVTTLAATAQVTGPDLYRGVSDQIGSQKVYRVEVGSDGIRLSDPATGREVLTMRQINSQQVSISGTLGQLEGISSEIREQIMQQIALFNYSSAVGTIVVDERSGEVTMHHNVNPRLVSTSAIAQVASRFGDTIMQQSRILAQ